MSESAILLIALMIFILILTAMVMYISENGN